MKKQRDKSATHDPKRAPAPRLRKAWRGRSGELLARYNRDWVIVRRALEQREAARTDHEQPMPPVACWPAATCPPPPRIAVAPSLW